MSTREPEIDGDEGGVVDAPPDGARGSHGLTPRERELVELLAGGADTRSIAESLFISEHTVQDHLKSIFDKTGTRNRRTLLARLAGS